MIKKQLLVLGSRIPFPTNDGGALACMQLLKILSKDNNLTYFSFNTRKHFVSDQIIDREFKFCTVISNPLDANPTIWGAIKSVIKFKNYNLSRFSNFNSKRKLYELLIKKEFDYVVFENIFTSGFLKIITKFNPNASLIYRAHNVEWKIWEKLAENHSGIRGLYLKKLSKSFKKAEEKFIKSVTKIVAITESDAMYFKTVNPSANVITIPVGVEISNEIHPATDNPTLYHLGSMEWMPNREGLEWFVNDVWPIIQESAPKSELHIAGRKLNKEDEAFAGQNIHNHGEIEDAQSFIAAHQICIVPIWSGSGLRIKTLEAMAQGKVVVSTQIGADGIDAQPHQDWLIANDAPTFAHSIIQLLNNPEQLKHISENALNYIQKNYSVDIVKEKWLELE